MFCVEEYMEVDHYRLSCECDAERVENIQTKYWQLMEMLSYVQFYKVLNWTRLLNSSLKDLDVVLEMKVGSLQKMSNARIGGIYEPYVCAINHVMNLVQLYVTCLYTHMTLFYVINTHIFGRYASQWCRFTWYEYVCHFGQYTWHHNEMFFNMTWTPISLKGTSLL